MFLLSIAPAVLNGGFSTFLAVALLVFSDVYVFVSFFKIFFLVVFFGLYNGLVFLPVLLTLVGPKNKNKQDSHRKTQPDDSRKVKHELASLNNSSAEEKWNINLLYRKLCQALLIFILNIMTKKVFVSFFKIFFLVKSNLFYLSLQTCHSPKIYDVWISRYESSVVR